MERVEANQIKWIKSTACAKDKVMLGGFLSTMEASSYSYLLRGQCLAWEHRVDEQTESQEVMPDWAL